jgi:hypothetical protein
MVCFGNLPRLSPPLKLYIEHRYAIHPERFVRKPAGGLAVAGNDLDQ